MGNIADRNANTESCDQEFYCDMIGQEIVHEPQPKPVEAKPATMRSNNFKRTDWSRRKTSTKVFFGRRRSSLKAMGRRRSSTPSLFKTRRPSKLLIKDMEIQVEDGKIAKLVPRESVLEEKSLAAAIRHSYVDKTEAMKESEMSSKIQAAQKRCLEIVTEISLRKSTP